MGPRRICTSCTSTIACKRNPSYLRIFFVFLFFFCFFLCFFAFLCFSVFLCFSAFSASLASLLFCFSAAASLIVCFRFSGFFLVFVCRSSLLQ